MNKDNKSNSLEKSQQQITFFKVGGILLLLLAITGFIFSIIEHTENNDNLSWVRSISFILLMVGIIFSSKASRKAKEIN